jgi:nitroreductase
MMKQDEQIAPVAEPGRAATVAEAVMTRKSVRGFLNRPVDGDMLRRVLTIASRAPSGCNLQPWHFHVVGGASLATLKTVMRARVVESPRGEATEYDILPADMATIYHERRFDVGLGLYEQLGIARDDRAARERWAAFNLEFFGAPVGLFCSIDRQLGPPQWADMGMALQTIMLLLRGEGLHSCPQEAWSLFPKTVREFLDLPSGLMLFCGMAIGYEDPDAPANAYVSGRAPLDDYATFLDI